MGNKSMKHIKAIASGKVQGVAFRMYAQTQAKQLGLKGYVRNLSNGNVEIVAVGAADKVDAFIDWAKSGSPAAIIDKLDVAIVNKSDNKYQSFDILK